MSREVTPNFKRVQKAAPSKLSADRRWANDVKRRDGKCQYAGCKSPLEAVQAHHIASRKQRPDLRHELANGVTLCINHHHWVHANPSEAVALGFISRERYEKAHRS